MNTDIYATMLATQAAARHRTPVAEYDHPKGVIVPYDDLLTENIRKDRDYAPYCGPCVPMQRLRRFKEGFRCPTCGNTSNWDLTPFNGNVDVKFDPEHMDDMAREWIAKQMQLKEIDALPVVPSLQRMIYEEHQRSPISWVDDIGKKNTSIHLCNKCMLSFFGKKSRKYCKPCQEDLTKKLETLGSAKRNSIYSSANRQDRRHGY